MGKDGAEEVRTLLLYRPRIVFSPVAISSHCTKSCHNKVESLKAPRQSWKFESIDVLLHLFSLVGYLGLVSITKFVVINKAKMYTGIEVA